MPLICLTSILICLAMPAGSKPPPAQPRQIVCERIAMGAWFRANGFASVVRWMPREQVPEEERRDAIFIRDDGETDQQKARWEELLLNGWKAQDEFMGAHAGAVKNPRRILEECLSSDES